MSILFVKPQLRFLASRYSGPFQPLKNNIMLLKMKSFLLPKGSSLQKLYTDNGNSFSNSLNPVQLQWKSKASPDYSKTSATISLKGTFILLSQEDWVRQRYNALDCKQNPFNLSYATINKQMRFTKFLFTIKTLKKSLVQITLEWLSSYSITQIICHLPSG